MKRFLIVLLSFLSISGVVNADFVDVNLADDYAVAIEWMENNGVVIGYEDGTFKPNQEVSRVEFLKMLYESMGKGGVNYKFPAPFSDLEENAWYLWYVDVAYNEEVVDGYEDGTFKPHDSINLAEAVKIVVNGFLSVGLPEYTSWIYDPCPLSQRDDVEFTYSEDEWYTDYVTVADGYCLLPSKMAIDGLTMDHLVTRGEMAEILYRAKTVRDEYDPEDGDNNYSPYFSYWAGYGPDSLIASNEFFINAIEVGDVIVGMKVTDIRLEENNDGADLSPYSWVTFEGDLVVSGFYDSVQNPGCLGLLESDSKRRLPILEAKNQAHYLICFENEDFAKTELAKFETNDLGLNKVTLLLSDYTAVNAVGDAPNTATLVEAGGWGTLRAQ